MCPRRERQIDSAPTVKTAIFDVDGTLVDSVNQHAKSWQAAFHEFGHDIPFDVIRAQIGKGGDQLMPVFLKPQDRGPGGRNRLVSDRRETRVTK